MDWKGKLSSSARLIFPLFAVYSSKANILFIATKLQSKNHPQ